MARFEEECVVQVMSVLQTGWLVPLEFFNLREEDMLTWKWNVVSGVSFGTWA